MAKIGTLIDGKYEVLREIGRGGMSVVYLAMDIRLNKQWAIKEIARKANDANNEIVVSSLLAEANLMKKLDHPALPRIVDIIEEQNTIFVVMDYIEGEPLSKILELYGAQDQDTVIEWGKQLCDVLFYLHNCEPPIIYRDMKPANVMLKPDGTVKLIDFGIAREYKRSKTADTESLGTRGYAAPEQFGGKGQTDARTDIYSFGVTLYHLVTGINPCEPPYELYPIKQINPSYYDGLQYLIQKCIQMNPEDRFQSCDEIRYVLDNIQEFDKGRRLSQKKKFSAFIVMVVLTIVFAILGSGSLMLGRAALDQSFGQNLSVISSSDDIARVNEAYNKMMNESNSGLSDLQKLRLYEEFYSAVDRISEADDDILASTVVSGNPFDYVEDDILSEEDAQEYDGNVYAELTSEQRTYIALSFFHQGNIAFKQNSASKGTLSFNETEKYLSYLFESNKLDLKSGKYEYNTELLTDDMINTAEAMYYLSIAYGYFNSSGSDNSASISLGDASADKMDIEEVFDKLIESTEILNKDVSSSIKLNMYRAYYSILSKPDRINSFRSGGISVEDVNTLYKAVYSEDYLNVYNDAVAKFGSVDTLKPDQLASLQPSDASGGIYAIAQTDNSLVQDIKNARVTISGYIYKTYNSK